MPRAIAGVLVKCDPSIKAIIMKIDAEHDHNIVIEDIDERHMLVKGNKHDELKQLLKDALKDTVKEADEDSESE